MGEKATTHTRIVATSLVHAASEQGKSRGLVQNLVDAHTLSGAGKKHKPFDALKPDMRALIEGELKKLDPAARKHLKAAGGYVDFTSREADPQLQTLAERVDKIVSNNVYENLPEVKARRTVQEIIAEIIKRNNW